MFTEFVSALLLAVGVVAVDSNCCTMYEDNHYRGTEVTLCYHSQDYPSYYDMRDMGINSVGSIKCGESINWKFCKDNCYSS